MRSSIPPARHGATATVRGRGWASIGGVGLARSGGLGLGLSQPRLALPPEPGFSGLSGHGLVGSDGEVAGCATGMSRSGMSSSA